MLVANPSYAVVSPGLWSYDAVTGGATTLIPGVDEDGSLNFVDWPHQLAWGELVFFYNKLPRFDPDVGIPST